MKATLKVSPHWYRSLRSADQEAADRLKAAEAAAIAQARADEALEALWRARVLQREALRDARKLLLSQISAWPQWRRAITE